MNTIKICSNSFQAILLLLIIVASFWLNTEAATFRADGRLLRAKKHPPRHHHHKGCEPGKLHASHECSPQESHRNKATLTLNSFEKDGDGGGASSCDEKFHKDSTLIVALSTRFFDHRKRCLKQITIFGNGRRVNAKVVDECDSSRGCANNIVDASKAVWKALGVPEKDWGQLEVFWSDA